MREVATQSALPDHRPHRCPWWIGWALVSPLRRLREKPEDLLEPLIRSGDRVLEIGPGMGFFTSTIARCVGTEGHVYCVDVQPRMLAGLQKRLSRQGVGDRIETRVCTDTDLNVTDLGGSIDLAVLIHVLHEMQDPRAALQSVAQAVRAHGKLLLVEPEGHVSPRLFAAELAAAAEIGFVPIQPPLEIHRRGALAQLLTLGA